MIAPPVTENWHGWPPQVWDGKKWVYVNLVTDGTILRKPKDGPLARDGHSGTRKKF